MPVETSTRSHAIVPHVLKAYLDHSTGQAFVAISFKGTQVTDIADVVEGIEPAVDIGDDAAIGGDGDDIKIAVVWGQGHEGGVIGIAAIANQPGLPDLALDLSTGGQFTYG